MDIPTSLEITVISAENLWLGKRPLNKNTFVTIRSDTQNHETTSIDTDGGSYPTWNEKLTLTLPAFVPSISVEVQCMTWSEVKTVGTASIPVSDFREPANYLHFLSYRLTGRDGKNNGIINLSIGINGGGCRVERIVQPMCRRDEEREEGLAVVGYPLFMGRKGR